MERKRQDVAVADSRDTRGSKKARTAPARAFGRKRERGDAGTGSDQPVAPGGVGRTRNVKVSDDLNETRFQVTPYLKV